MEVSLLHFTWAIGLGLVSAVSLPLYSFSKVLSEWRKFLSYHFSCR